eukprot:5522428-Pleurochrysis_carterae.AAC.1
MPHSAQAEHLSFAHGKAQTRKGTDTERHRHGKAQTRPWAVWQSRVFGRHERRRRHALAVRPSASPRARSEPARGRACERLSR